MIIFKICDFDFMFFSSSVYSLVCYTRGYIHDQKLGLVLKKNSTNLLT